jgi:methyl-accepting chemotaxis protein
MVNRLSLKVRLFLLISLPLLLLVGTSTYLLYHIQLTVKDMSSSLYETTNKSTSLILNADRDMYQALIAYELAVSGTLSAEEKQKQVSAVYENVEQTNKRVNQASEILKAKQLLTLAHTESKQSLEGNFASFHQFFGQWVQAADPKMQAKQGVMNDSALMETFEKGRDGLNQIGEILDQYARSSIELKHEEATKTSWTIALVIAVLVVVIGVLGFWMIRQITTTVQRIVQLTRSVAEGDLRALPQAVYGKDELGQITQAVDAMIGKLKQLLSSIAHNTNYVQAASSELSDCSKESAKAADHVALNIQEVTIDVEVQSRSAAETSRAIEEMAIGIQRIAELTGGVAECSTTTSNHAEEGSQQLVRLQHQMNLVLASIEQLSGTVSSLHRKSDEIDKIALSITTFANQTNLLSLNASIEAARAGEHGKGFSVVANEIRKLAAQSVLSAEGINELVKETRSEIDNVTTSMGRTASEANTSSSILSEVNQGFETIVKAVQQIVIQLHETSAITEQMSASSEEVAASTEQFSVSANQIHGKSEGVAAATQQQLAMMDNISTSAAQLTEVVSSLNQSVAYFKIS